jgi:hypothetical protein
LHQVWDWYEGIDHYLHPAESIVDAPWGVFRVTVDRYAGPAFTLPDDTFVSGGDQLCRLHISYPVLMRLVAQSPAQLERAMTDDLQALAASIERGYLPRNIRAVYGVTILAHGSERLGFSVRRRPRTEPRAIGPDEVWMSRDELLRRYGSRPSSRY